MAKSAIKNKDLSYDIARACKIPIDVARKVLSVLLACMVKDLRVNKLLHIRDFGRFRLGKYKRVHIPSGFVPASKYSVSFQPRGKLAEIMYSKWFKKYEWHLANKYKRLKKEGKNKEAKLIKEKIRTRLANNRSMQRWLWERGRLPYPFDPNECGTSNARETEN